MRSVYATFIRNWTVTLRAYPWTFFISTFLAAGYSVGLAYFSYHFLAGGEISGDFATQAGTRDYISFVVLGAGAYLLSIRILLGLSRTLIMERREGTLESLLLAPSGRFGYLVAVAAQSALTAMFETVLMMAIAWPLGFSIAHVNLGSLCIALAVALLSLFGMGTVLGAVMLATGDTYVVQNTLFALMGLVCGFSFPTGYLPTALQSLGAVLPVTGGLSLLRSAVLQGTPPLQIVPRALAYALLSLLYALVGLLLLRHAERRALEGER